MPWVKVRIEGEQKGRIIHAFGLMGIPEGRIKFYEKSRGDKGWMGYSSLEVHPPTNVQTAAAPAQAPRQAPAPRPAPESIYDSPRGDENAPAPRPAAQAPRPAPQPAPKPAPAPAPPLVVEPRKPGQRDLTEEPVHAPMIQRRPKE